MALIDYCDNPQLSSVGWFNKKRPAKCIHPPFSVLNKYINVFIFHRSPCSVSGDFMNGDFFLSPLWTKEAGLKCWSGIICAMSANSGRFRYAQLQVLHDVNSAIPKNAQKKIKCKTIVTINSLKLGVLLAKIYTCYDVFYRLYTVCTVLMKYMYTVQLLYVCWIKYLNMRLDFFSSTTLWYKEDWIL